MIDDTLFSCLGTSELKKLVDYESNMMHRLQFNIDTIQSKLAKKSLDFPKKEHRLAMLKQMRSSSKLKYAEMQNNIEKVMQQKLQEMDKQNKL